MEELGQTIGMRAIELVSCRDRLTKRETRVVGMLQVIKLLLILVFSHSLISLVYFECHLEISFRESCRQSRKVYGKWRWMWGSFILIFYPSYSKRLYLIFFSLRVDMIHESAPITNTFVSVPADLGQLNCACFIGGIIAGILESSRFVSKYFAQ